MALPRSAARIRRFMRAAATAALFAVLGGLLFVVGALVHSLVSIDAAHWGALLRVSVLFAIAGAIFGTIVAFDRSADASWLKWRFIRRLESPAWRTLLCAVLGALAVVVIQSMVATRLPAAWMAIGAACGAALGWFGWRWARYVDF